MPFDAAGFPKEDGAYPAEPTPVERWLHYLVAVLFILASGAGAARVGCSLEFMGHVPRYLASLNGKRDAYLRSHC